MTVIQPKDGVHPAALDRIAEASPVRGNEDRYRMHTPADLPCFVEVDRIVKNGALWGWQMRLHFLNRGTVTIDCNREDAAFLGVNVNDGKTPSPVGRIQSGDVEGGWDPRPPMPRTGAAERRAAVVEERERAARKPKPKKKVVRKPTPEPDDFDWE